MTANTAAKHCLFTIGHSDHEMQELMPLLSRHRIDTIADVRSQPYSRFSPQFNREVLKDCLKIAGIDYVFLGRELGARRAERESYRGRQARYDLISHLPAFQEGLDWIRREIPSRRISLLCAEKDPLECHRTILVCRHLRSDPLEINHILEDGSIENTDQAESRLLELVGLPPANLFQNRLDLIEEAYDRQANRIAYTESEEKRVISGGIA
jgi:uncharacterized protein (DUF488 family)